MRRSIALIGILTIAAVAMAACGAAEPTPSPTNIAQPTSTPAQGDNGDGTPQPTGEATPSGTQPPNGDGTPTNGGAGDAANGEQLFASTCASCHGQDATGIEGLGKDLVNSEFVAGQSDEELVAFIEQGRPVDDPMNTTGVAMPPKGGNASLTEQDLRDIVAFIRSLSQ